MLIIISGKAKSGTTDTLLRLMLERKEKCAWMSFYEKPSQVFNRAERIGYQFDDIHGDITFFEHGDLFDNIKECVDIGIENIYIDDYLIFDGYVDLKDSLEKLDLISKKENLNIYITQQTSRN